MRKTAFVLQYALFLLIILLPLAALGAADQSPAGPAAAQTGLPAAAVEALPVTKVVLFNTGLGFIEREGSVTGSGSLELSFNARDVNDLLKSFLVRDLDGGRITGVTYPSRDPVSRTLKSYAVDLTANPGLAAILNQLRGEEVEVYAGRRVAGTILGVETRRRADGNEEAMLNLLTPQGLVGVGLLAVESTSFADKRLDAELRAALKLLAEGRAADRRSVTVSYLGDGRRRIRAGYIREAPVWKTSYRLSVSPDGRSGLQGWAVVENMTDEDWRGVKLDLISGLPISFVMDLYRPVYNPRPQVAVPLPPTINPQTYDEGLASGAGPGAPPPAPAPSAMSAPRAAPAREYAKRAEKPMAGLAEAAADREEEPDFSAGIAAAARSESVGEFFRYAIAEPVTLARQKSAMLPIVTQAIETERLSIYNESTLAKNPLNGLRLKNNTGLNLMAGPITVFEDGVYAGDARIDNLQPNGTRLVTFSVDQDVEVLRLDPGQPEAITSLRAYRGALLVTRLVKKERVYTVVNRGQKQKQLLIEHPASQGWKLVEPAAPAERTEALYRFSLAAAPGADKRVSLSVREERTVEQSVSLSSASFDSIQFYMNQRVISPALLSAFKELVRIKNDYGDVTRRRQLEEGRIQTIHREQERIRNNMSSLSQSSALYKRYVESLNQQENALEQLVEKVDGLKQEEAAKKKAIEDYLAKLTVE